MNCGRLLAIAAAAWLAGCATRPAATVAVGAGACAALRGTAFDNGVVTATDYVAQGADLIPAEMRAIIKATRKVDLPALPAPRGLCRARAELRPVPGSLIKAQVWLPDAWNEKLFTNGGAGFNGGMFKDAYGMYAGAQRGFATLLSDAGHDPTDSAKFAYDGREKLIDYGHRANHAAAVFAKALIARHYGKPVRHAYFKGGSNGGREALMEARRYPEDYDGIFAGQPAMSMTTLFASFLWNRHAIRDTPGAGKLKAKLPLLAAAVLKKCDGIDGVMDSLIEDPTRCNFDPAELRCMSADRPDCLNADEITVLQKIYGGPRLGDGRQLFPGMALGGEGGKDNWENWLFADHAQQASGGEEFGRWIVHGDPAWKVDQFDLYADYHLSKERVAPIVDSDDPDLGAFLGRGGKLLLEHGWNDAAIPPGSTLNYYAALREKVGAQLVDRQVRLFMVPGMGHVPLGTVADDIPWLDELDRWVEGAPAPETVIATQYDRPLSFGARDPAAKVVRTRLICAWPKHARHDGAGSIDDQASYRCN